MPNSLPTSIENLSDLIRRCSLGDAAAWDEFVSRFHRKIALYAFRMARFDGRGTTDARGDLIQDVYVKLLSNNCRALVAWRGETEQSFTSYLATVVHAVACDAVKRGRSQKRSALLVSLDGIDADDAPPLADRLRAPATSCPELQLLERLAPERLAVALERAERGPQARRNRVIFKLYVMDGLTASEIATLPGFHMSTANVESTIRRTRERLRFVLRDARSL